MSKSTFFVRLRPFSEKHLDRTYIWMNDMRIVHPFGRTAHLPRSEHQHWFHEVRRSNNEQIFAIEIGSARIHIGNIGLKAIDTRNLNAEVWIYIGDTRYQGKGYARKALILLMKHAFQKLKLHRLQAWILDSNKRSIHFFKSCGFEEEGYLRDTLIFEEAYQSVRLVAYTNRKSSAFKQNDGSSRQDSKRKGGARIFFYCDISKQEGLGHFRRCSFFADQIKEKTFARPTFLLRPSRKFKFLKRLIRLTTGFDAWQVKEKTPVFWEKIKDAKLLVIDSYKFTPEKLITWRRFFPGAVVIIDDFNRNFVGADLIISPNAVAKENTGTSEMNGSLTRLHGVEFFVANRRYEQLNRKNRRINAELKRVFVSIGGNPNSIMLQEIIWAIKNTLGNKVKVHVTAGPFGRISGTSLERIVEKYPNVQLLDNASDVTQELLWCDVAIISGGVTKFEAAITGTPSIIIPQHPAQIPFVKAFVKKEKLMFTGNGRHVSTKELGGLFRLLGAQHRRKQISQSLKKEIDGKGFRRIWPRLKELVN